MRTKTNNQVPLLVLAALSGLFGLSIQLAFGQAVDPAAVTDTVSPSAATTTAPDQNTITDADPIAAINAQIEEKKKRIAELQQQAEAYRQAADKALSEVKDIDSQIKSIDNQIAETNFAIQAKQEELDSLDLQMKALQQSIDLKTSAINGQKSKLADVVRQLDANSRTTTLALVMTHNSLAEFYSQAEATASISQSLGDSIGVLKRLRRDLQSRQDELSATRDDQKQAQNQLQIQKQSTEDQKSLKDQLLSTTKRSADQLQTLVEQSAREEQQANATINALEAQLREKLSGASPDASFSSTGLIWPVGSRDISAYFHDADYPYRRFIGEHSGLDVRAPVGTPIRAAADGIVSAAFSPDYTYRNGRKVSALNFVALIHPSIQGMSTRYLHLSAIYVQPDQVIKQGDIIGLSGGAWGAPGSGAYSSGPHLHFEVRLDGLPDDPLKYLPSA